MPDLRSSVDVSLERESYDHVKLNIRRTIGGDEKGISFGLHMPEARLWHIKILIPDILSSFREEVGLYERWPGKLSEQRAQIAIERLRNATWGILDLLFENSGLETKKCIGEIREYLQPVFGSANLPGGGPPIVRLEAATKDPLAWLLPLELFPVADTEKDPGSAVGLAVQPYLGFRAAIARCQRSASRIFPRNDSGHLPIRTFSYRGRDLKGVARQMEFFQDHSSDIAIVVDWPGRGSDLQELNNLACQLLEGNEILHFCCHYRPGGQATQPRLDFGAIRIPLVDLRGKMAQLTGGRADLQRPLVFLNACQTAGAAQSAESLMKLLVDNQYYNILGSETLLPDRVAGEFAVLLYKTILGDPAMWFGKAVLDARQRLLAEFNNPAGILYTFSGDPGLQIAPPPLRRPDDGEEVSVVKRLGGGLLRVLGRGWIWGKQ